MNKIRIRIRERFQSCFSYKTDFRLFISLRRFHISKWKLYGLLILMIINPLNALARESDMKHEKINVCDYNAQNIKELEEKLNQIILFSNETNLASFFQNTPHKPQHIKRVKSRLNKITGIPLGKTHSIFFRCSVSNENINEWVLIVLENEEEIITKLDLYLFYADENFSARNELISSDRFRNSTELAKAVNDQRKLYKYSREEFRSEMLNGGFLLHRSCANEKGKSDIYFVPPLPPESVLGLSGVHLWPNATIKIGVAFSSINENFLYAESIQYGLRACFISEAYEKQFIKYLMKNYPNSWLTHFVVQENLKK